MRTGNDEGLSHQRSACLYRVEDFIDVVELHDAAAPGELFGYEDLRLCGPGEAPKLLASGETHLGGRVPVNPSGGLLARGHPIGATGVMLFQTVLDELERRDLQRGLVAMCTGGGMGTATIIERV